MPLEGELVILREERESDLPALVSLRNDLATQAWSRTLPPDYTLEMYRKRYVGRDFSFSPKQGRFVIEDKQTGEPIGTASYMDLEDRLEATIGVATAQSYWGTGAGREAVEVLLRFLFLELGLRVVRLWTQSSNRAAIGLAQKCGFRIAIRLREAIFKAGQPVDNINMDLLREEYFARHPEAEDKLPPLEFETG